MSVGDDSDEDDDLDMSEEEKPTPGQTSTSSQPEIASTCTLCRTSLTPVSDRQHHKPMGLVSFVQRSNVLATAQAQASCSKWWGDQFQMATRSTDAHDVPDLDAFDLNTQWQPYRKAVGDMYARLRRRDDDTIHTVSCGHCIHVDCFTRYLYLSDMLVTLL